MNDNEREMFVEMYIFENNKMMEELEQWLLSSEQDGFTQESLNEIFRIMHTIKGSSNTMGFENIGKLSHTIEDLLDFLRGNIDLEYDKKELYDLLLDGMDALNLETSKLQNGEVIDTDFSELIKKFKAYLEKINSKKKDINIEISKQKEEELLGIKYKKIDFDINSSEHTYYAKVFFIDDCEMAHLRAFELVNKIKNSVRIKEHIPFKFDSSENEKLIKRKGFQLIFQSNMTKDDIVDLIEENSFYLKKLDLFVVKDIENINDYIDLKDKNYDKSKITNKNNKKVEIIGVNVEKLDKLMDITSEIIITEAILTQNPDLDGLKLRNFKKAARQFNKITNELQDIVMSIRMVSLSATFNKLKRLTRDMASKLDKKVQIEVVGEKTEVDKNIIDSISDPLIHLLRNSIDHGIEPPEERFKKGKKEIGNLKLEAKNVGSEVWISIEDDGKGLDTNKILEKAVRQGLVSDDENLDKKRIFSFIFKPGFSTKDTASEYSGRGVGMDIVKKNIERIFGNIDVDSEVGKGTIFTIKIPLTLAIIKGITVKVGESKFTAPVDSVEEVIILEEENIVSYPDGSQIIKIRENFYDIVKLSEKFNIKSKVGSLTEGTTLLVNARGSKMCIFVDELIGEQQVVVKPLPKYIDYVEFIAGCTLLGDGTISLILDLEALSKIRTSKAKKMNLVGKV
jgi:two-component system chemotaxis sensor kinase CheA